MVVLIVDMYVVINILEIIIIAAHVILIVFNVMAKKIVIVIVVNILFIKIILITNVFIIILIILIIGIFVKMDSTILIQLTMISSYHNKDYVSYAINDVLNVLDLLFQIAKIVRIY